MNPLLSQVSKGFNLALSQFLSSSFTPTPKKLKPSLFNSFSPLQSQIKRFLVKLIS